MDKDSTIRMPSSRRVFGLSVVLAIAGYASAQNRPVVDDGTVTETHRQTTIKAPVSGLTKASRPNNSVLFIETGGVDAEIKVNGIPRGKTTNGERRLELPTGRHYEIEVTAGPDYQPYTDRITLDRMRVVEARLLSRFGTVRIGPRFRDGRGELRLDGQPLSPDQLQVDQESDLIVISRLAAGTRTITYDHPDYVIVKHSFNISPGSDLTWTFQPELAVDELSVETLPGVSIYVDGKHYGETASDGKLKVSIPLGKYEAKLEKYGFSPYKGDFDFTFRAPVMIKQMLVPLPNSAEFHEFFDIPQAFSKAWALPASGWTLEKNRLHIGDCGLMYPKDSNYNDFTMAFHLKLENRGGAAWVVRVKDPSNYYLFYITGPDGPLANKFLTYIVRGGKLDPAQPYDSVPLLFHLESGGEYSIEISAKKNVIENFITPAKTGKRIGVGVLKDNDNFFPYGTIGFRTVGSEKFSVGELFVRPPEVKPNTGIATPGQSKGWPQQDGRFWQAPFQREVDRRVWSGG